MLDLVSFLLKEEQAWIQSELHGKCVFMVFDGTTRLGEVLAVIVRFVTDWSVQQQRLVQLEVLLKSVTGEELAR